MESPLEPLINFVILAVAASYLYKAVKQIVKKDVSFYKQEIYTDKSVEKWAIVDGLIKAFVATVCVVYAALCLVGIKVFWYVPVCIVLSLAAYLIGYRKILVKDLACGSDYTTHGAVNETQIKSSKTRK